MAAQNNRNNNANENRPRREVDPLTTRILSKMGEEIGIHLADGRPLTAEGLLKSSVGVAAGLFMLPDIESESLSGVLKGSVTRILDLFKKRTSGKGQAKTPMTPEQAAEWATQILVDDYAKSKDDSEKNPNLFVVLDMLHIGESRIVSRYLNSRHMFDPKELVGNEPTPAEVSAYDGAVSAAKTLADDALNATAVEKERKKIREDLVFKLEKLEQDFEDLQDSKFKSKIAEARKKIIGSGPKIIMPIREVRGALRQPREMRHEMLRKIIRIPEETGMIAIVKKHTGLDLSKPEKFLDQINVDGVADNLNAQAEEALWRAAIYERNKLERDKNQPSFFRSLVNGFKRAWNYLKQLIGW